MHPVIVPWHDPAMLRKTLVGLLVVVVLAGVALVGAGYYFSTLLTADGEPWQTRDKAVLAYDGDTVTVALDTETALAGRHGLLWDGGLTQVDAQLQVDEQNEQVTYQVADTSVPVPVPTDAAWYAWYYDGTPADLGLDFSEVSPRSEVGDLPSWYLPGDGDTWVIGIHGHNGDREEALRALPTLAELGLPTVVMRYRNDEGVASPDGLVHLGDTEWRDVDAVMTWAREQGAERFVLYGWSMGGAIAMQALDRAQNRDAVDAVVLDGPVLDWRALLDLQAADRGLPAVLADVGAQITEWRIGIDFDDFDWVARADEIDVPVLVFHGPGDGYVPWEPSRDLAAARPDLVRLEQVDGAGHTRSWNADPERYARVVTQFLTPVAAQQ